MSNQSDQISKMTMNYFISATLKGISQVILLENAVSGLIILAAITIANYQLGIAALLSAVTGTLIAHASGGDKNAVEKGLFGYNSVLTGMAMYLFLTGSMRIVIAIIAAAFVVIFTASMMHFLKNLSIPVLTFPYIVLTWLFLLPSYHLNFFRISSDLVPQDLSHRQLNTEGTVNVIDGLVNGFGQVYFQHSLLPCILIILAVFWANRKIGIYALIGTVTSWLTAYALGPEQNVLNLGLYGYNAVLTIIAVGSVFEADRPFALIWGIVAAIFTVPITAGMDTWLSIYGLPALTMPFVLVSWIFISARRVLPKI